MKNYISRNKEARLSVKVRSTWEFRVFKKKYDQAIIDPRVKPGWFTVLVWHYFPDSWYSKWSHNKMRKILYEIMQVSEADFDLMVKYL